MKVNWNVKYTTIAVYSFLVVSAIILFFLGITQLNYVIDKFSYFVGVLQPIIMGFAIAYLFNFILKFYEENILRDGFIKKIRLKSKRGLGLLLTYLTVLLVVILFMQFVFPQLVESVVGLVNSVPVYIDNLSSFLTELLSNLDVDEKFQSIATENINQFINTVIKFATNLIPILGTFLASIASSVWNIVLGIIVSIYILADKEKFLGLSKKIVFAVFPKRYANKVIELTHRSNNTFGKFLSGKILDSVIIGILTFIVLTITKMPYTLLVSVIIGITNIIPFFGPFIGAIPSILIILFVSPVKALWFLLIIVIIQQIDGNIIGPKILGDSIGISAFWILFSILVTGKLLGILGMIIGVPLFAVVYGIIKDIVENKLAKKGLKTSTKDYM